MKFYEFILKINNELVFPAIQNKINIDHLVDDFRFESDAIWALYHFIPRIIKRVVNPKFNLSYHLNGESNYSRWLFYLDHENFSVLTPETMKEISLPSIYNTPEKREWFYKLVNGTLSETYYLREFERMKAYLKDRYHVEIY
jgi:hypothetical protein